MCRITWFCPNNSRPRRIAFSAITSFFLCYGVPLLFWDIQSTPGNLLGARCEPFLWQRLWRQHLLLYWHIRGFSARHHKRGPHKSTKPQYSLPILFLREWHKEWTWTKQRRAAVGPPFVCYPFPVGATPIKDIVPEYGNISVFNIENQRCSLCRLSKNGFIHSSQVTRLLLPPACPDAVKNPWRG